MSHIKQDQNLERVSSRIARSIMTFCRSAFAREGSTFRMDDLLLHVRLSAGIVAPDSPSRILRQLRAQGRLDYEVINRAQSTYRITSLKGAPT